MEELSQQERKERYLEAVRLQVQLHRMMARATLYATGILSSMSDQELRAVEQELEGESGKS